VTVVSSELRAILLYKICKTSHWPCRIVNSAMPSMARNISNTSDTQTHRQLYTGYTISLANWVNGCHQFNCYFYTLEISNIRNNHFGLTGPTALCTNNQPIFAYMLWSVWHRIRCACAKQINKLLLLNSSPTFLSTMRKSIHAIC